MLGDPKVFRTGLDHPITFVLDYGARIKPLLSLCVDNGCRLTAMTPSGSHLLSSVLMSAAEPSAAWYLYMPSPINLPLAPLPRVVTYIRVTPPPHPELALVLVLSTSRRLVAEATAAIGATPYAVFRLAYTKQSSDRSVTLDLAFAQRSQDFPSDGYWAAVAGDESKAAEVVTLPHAAVPRAAPLPEPQPITPAPSPTTAPLGRLSLLPSAVREFSCTSLPLTERAGRHLETSLAAQMGDLPEGWHYIDRVVALLLPALRNDIAAFYTNGGPSLVDLFAEHQIAHLDRDLYDALMSAPPPKRPSRVGKRGIRKSGDASDDGA